MPIYEYKCDRGHVFDVMQRMSDDPLSACEDCGAPVQRVFHPVAVHFKGSGFYNTDYGTRRRSREKEAGDGAGASEGGKSETGTSETGKSDTAKSGSSKPEPAKAESSKTPASSSN